MTVAPFRPHTHAASGAAPAPTGRLRDLFAALGGRRSAAPSESAETTRPLTTALHTTAATPWTTRGALALTLQDGVERQYLLNPRDFAVTTSPRVAYDARVHAAYILATQGHRPEWLAPHLDLPLAATSAVCAEADRHGPHGPHNAVTRD